MNDQTLSHVPDFTVAVGTSRGVHHVRLSGELDVATASQLRDVLAGLTGATLVVDVSGLRFVDAAGLSALVLAIHRGEEPRRRLTVRGARGLVRRVIQAGGLGELLEDAAA